jgi:hypothetical protein
VLLVDVFVRELNDAGLGYHSSQSENLQRDRVKLAELESPLLAQVALVVLSTMSSKYDRPFGSIRCDLTIEHIYN